MGRGGTSCEGSGTPGINGDKKDLGGLVMSWYHFWMDIVVVVAAAVVVVVVVVVVCLFVCLFVCNFLLSRWPMANKTY